MTETLLLAETNKYAQMETFIADRYLPVTIPAGVWDLVAAIRRELAPAGFIEDFRSRTWSSRRLRSASS